MQKIAIKRIFPQIKRDFPRNWKTTATKKVSESDIIKSQIAMKNNEGEK